MSALSAQAVVNAAPDKQLLEMSPPRRFQCNNSGVPHSVNNDIPAVAEGVLLIITLFLQWRGFSSGGIAEHGPRQKWSYKVFI